MATSSAAPRKRIHFIPLESNPDVFTELIHSLGVSKSLCFQDVLSLDDPDLLAFLPRPALALVLVFPTTVAYRDRVSQIFEAPSSGTEEEEDVVYFKQTINNACGLYALLHAVCNGDAREKLGKWSSHHAHVE
jgi:ubiquitin carboxyl-terminal hydrolase L3